MGFLDRLIDRNVEKFIHSMFASGQSEAEFSNLVFDAARVYAQNNGASSYPDMPDTIGFDKEFGGRNYWIFFMRGRAGRGTSISLSPQPSGLERAEAHSNAVVWSSIELDPQFQDLLSDLWALPEEEFTRRPSWDGDEKKVEEFGETLTSALGVSDIAPAYWAMLFKTPEARGMLLAFVSLVEDGGSSFHKQQSYAFAMIKHMWGRLTPENQRKFEALGRP